MSSRAEEISQAIEDLSRRIEAAEHRSSLAITGIDQSVLGVISRLQSAEVAQSEQAGRYQGALEEMRGQQDDVAERLQRMEADATGQRNHEAIKSLEAALARVANQVNEAEGSADAKLAALQAGLANITEDVERAASELTRSTEQKAEQTALQLRRMREELEDEVAKRVSAVVGELDKRVETLDAKLETGLDAAQSRSAAAADDIEHKLGGRLAELEANVSERGSKLESALAAEIARAGDEQQRKLDAVRADVDSQLQTSHDELISTLGEVRADVEGRVEAAEARTEDAVNDLVRRVESAETRVDAGLKAANEAIERRTSEIETDARARAKSVSDELGRRIAETETKWQESVSAAGEAVERRLSEIDTDSRARSRAAAEEMARRLAESDAKLAQDLRAVRDETTSAQTELREHVEQTLEGKVEEVRERLGVAETATNEAVRALGESLAELDGRVHSAEGWITQDPERAEATLQEVRAIADAAQRDAKEAVERAETAGREGAEKAEALAQEISRDTAKKVLEAAEALKLSVDGMLDKSAAALDEARGEAQGAQKRAEDTAAELQEVESRFTDRFETLGRRLAEMVADTRVEIAEHLDQITTDFERDSLRERLEQLSEQVEASERRNVDLIERIGVEIAKMTTAVDQRFVRADAQMADLARRQLETGDSDSLVESRLREIESQSARAVTRIGEEVAEVAERIDQRITAAEHRSDAILEGMSAEVRRLSDRMDSVGVFGDADLSQRIRDSEDRTRAMVEDALSNIHRRLDDAYDQTSSALSPIQRSLSLLQSRLETIEHNGGAYDRADVAGVEPPPFDDPLPDFRGGDRRVTDSRYEDDEPQTSFPRDDESFSTSARLEGGYDDDAPASRFAYDSDFPDASDRGERRPADRELRRIGEGDLDDDYLDGEDDEFDDIRSPARDDYAADHADERAENRPRKGRRAVAAVGGLALVAVFAAAIILIFEAGRRQSERGPLTTTDLPTSRGGVASVAPPADAPAARIAELGAAGVQPSADIVGEPAGVEDLADPAPAETAPGATVDVAAPETAPSVAEAAPQEEPTAAPPSEPLPEPEQQTQLAAVDAPPANVTPAPVDAGGAAPATTGSTLEQAADAGDPIAQFQLGDAALNAGAVDAGVRMVRQSAENGLAIAQYRLAKLFENGRGVPRDFGEARRWTERAASGGNRKAMHNLAIYFAEGRGAPQDFAEAARWFEEASMLGATDSQYNLAVLYEQGLGVPLSLPDAYAWYSIAGQAGDEEAARRAEALINRLTPDAKDRADEAVARFRPGRMDDVANGVFASAPVGGPDSREISVARAQALLATLGYSPGPADGAIGARTREAIRSYQDDRGIAVTGDVDAALLARLEAETAR